MQFLPCQKQNLCLSFKMVFNLYIRRLINTTSMKGMQPFPHRESKTPESNGKFWLNLSVILLSVSEFSIYSKIATQLGKNPVN